MRAAVPWMAFPALALAACAASAPAGDANPPDGPLGTHLNRPDAAAGSDGELPRPQLVDVAPRRVPAGSEHVVLRLLSRDFADQGLVFAQLPGAPVVTLPVVSRSDDLLVVVMRDSLLEKPADLQLTLRNPPPGGGDSSAFTFHVEKPFVPPRIDELLPRTVPPQQTDLSVVIRGRALDPRGSMWIRRENGSDPLVLLATTARSDESWTVLVPARFVVAPDLLLLRYETADGATSEERALDVAEGGFLTLAREAAGGLAAADDAVFATVNRADSALIEAPFDGSGEVVLAHDLENPGDLAIAGDELFWSAIHGNEVVKLPLAGGLVTGAVASAGLDGPLVSAGDMLFWSASGGIHRALRDGRDDTRLGTCPGCAPGGLATGAGALFWASPVNGTVTRIALDAPPTTAAVPMFLGSGLSPRRVAVGGAHLWLASDGARTGLWRADLDGENLVRIREGSVGGLAADDAGVYWTSGARLYRLAPDDPDPIVVAEGIGLSSRAAAYGAVALTSTHVAWSTDRAVVALPRTSAGVTDLGPGIITAGGCTSAHPILLTVGAAATNVFAEYASASATACPALSATNLAWSVDDPALASVSVSSGAARVVGLAVGTTTLRARGDGFDAAVTLRMALASGAFLADECAGSDELHLAPGLTRDIGGFLGLRGQDCTPYGLSLSWVSSDPAVFSIESHDARATVTALARGRALLVAQGPGFLARLPVVVE